MIHPTSVFATDPEVLLLPEEESRDMGNNDRYSQEIKLAWMLIDSLSFFHSLSVSAYS